MKRKERKVWRRGEVLGLGEKKRQLTTKGSVTIKGREIKPVPLPTLHIPPKCQEIESPNLNLLGKSQVKWLQGRNAGTKR